MAPVSTVAPRMPMRFILTAIAIALVVVITTKVSRLTEAMRRLLQRLQTSFAVSVSPYLSVV
jgi:hypothetical protein